MQIEFTWDQKKNEINQKKHGVSFEEAKTCFKDENAKVFFDVEHSSKEDRSILVGLSGILRTLVVVFTERQGIDAEHIVNRIISARKTTKKETQYYWNERKGNCL
ncbi:MAG: BrnT family toxin [Fibrobacter sp.]|nr:BrnT family toxin [Fibrobacter sp.]